MEGKIILRNISENDIEWVRKLRNKNREFFFDNKIISREQQQEWYKSLNYPLFIIKYQGKRVGTIAVKPSYRKCEINNVMIDEKHRRKGILMQAISLIEKKYGKPLYVDVFKKTAKIYKKLGFCIFGYKMKKG